MWCWFMGLGLMGRAGPENYSAFAGQRGLHAVAVQNPLSSVADDVASTNRLINAQDGPVLLVGHSYGGAVITEAGNNPKVAGLVYVAAFARGRRDAWRHGSEIPSDSDFGEIQPIEDGYLLLTRKGIFDFFAQDLAPAEKERSAGGARRDAECDPLDSHQRGAAWHSKPSWFVVAYQRSGDFAGTGSQHRQADGRKTLAFASSRLPMLSHPDRSGQFRD